MQPFTLSEISQNNINTQLQKYRISEGGIPSHEAEISAFLARQEAIDKPAAFGDQFFVAFTLYNDTEESAWYLYPYGSLVNNIDIYFYRGEQTTVNKTGLAASKVSTVDYHYGDAFSLAPGESLSIIMRFESDFFFAPIKIVVSPEDKKVSSLETENRIIILCLGMCFALAIYNMFLFFGSRQWMYLFYSLQIMSLALGYANLLGVIARHTSIDSARWVDTPFLVGTIFFLCFCNSFLKLKKNAPLLYRISIVLGLCILGLSPIAYYRPDIGMVIATFSTTISLTIVGLVAGIGSWRQGYSSAKYFVLALLAIITPGMMSNLSNLGVIPVLNVNIFLFGLIGSALEGLLFAFALAEKVRITNAVNIDLTLNLEKKVTKRTEELSKATKIAEHATNAKSDFLAKMSHEIRTPMNAIIGLSRLTLKTKLKPQQQDYVEKILDSGEVLLNLINQVLDFSKIEAGKLTIERTRFRLDKLLKRAVNLNALRAHDKGLELVTDVASNVPPVLVGDSLRIQQVIVNLVSNAVKFTERGTICIKIRVKAEAEEKVVLQCSVIDTGIGMSKKQQDKMFKSFSQADETVTRKYGGTGLGLAISKQLAELMGGAIWLESELGKGSTFHFTTIVEKTDEHIHTQPAIKQKMANLKVLVVDDLVLARNVLTELLLMLDINADQAESGEKAIEMVAQAQGKSSPYDLVFMDWRMPGMDGIEASRRIYKENLTDSPHILMVSAHDKEEARKCINDTIISQFIEKPVSASMLVDSITGLLVGEPGGVVEEQRNEDIEIPNFSESNILLVEDNLINRQVALGFLDDCGVNVDVAENGLIAIDKVQKFNYDLVLMDIQMPEMDGLTATSEIRNTLKLLNLPIVAMTAHALEEDMQKSKQAGMNDHITKPIDPDTLYRTLDKYLMAVEGDLVIESVTADSDNNSADVMESDVMLEQLTLIEELNTNLALQRLNGKTELYLSLVNDFYREKQGYIDECKRLFEDASWDVLYRHMHSLKSSGAYIGAYDLSVNCADMEVALTAGIHDKKLLNDCCIELEQILDQLKLICTARALPAGDIVFSIERLQEILKNLLPLLEMSDLSAEEYIPQLLQMNVENEYSAGIESVVKNIDKVEYEKATQLTSELLRKLDRAIG